jgi:hypothetical protein
MKKNWKIVLLVLLFGMGILVCVVAQEEMSVNVKETQLRSSPSFLGKVESLLLYGDRLEILGSRGPWKEAKFSGERGWVHESALTEKRVVLKAGASDVDKTADSGEVALAGRGFNERVEEEYKSQRDLDYTWVDKMEEFGLSPELLVTFLESADLEMGSQE